MYMCISTGFFFHLTYVGVSPWIWWDFDIPVAMLELGICECAHKGSLIVLSQVCFYEFC